MKLVQLLAKELKEWPEGAKYITQEDDDGSVTLWYRAKPKYKSGEWVLDRDLDGSRDYAYILQGIDTASDNKTSIVTQDQWQAEREKMNKPKWIRHRGGKCPVKAGTKVVTRYRYGMVSDWCMTRDQDTSEEWLSAVWSHSGGETDIMAYYVEETKDQEIEEVIPKHMAFGYASKEEMVAQIGEECPFAQVASAAEKTNFGTITYKLEIDATEATKEIDSLVAKWGQIVSPLKWRDAIIHCQAIIEDCEREIERNVNLLDAEGLMMQKDSKKAMQHYATDVDMSDWRNWQAGDIVECINHKGWVDISEGSQYVLNNKDFFSFVDDDGENRSFNLEEMNQENVGSDFKFIRRP